jgi:leucyl-tRNA synthetase
MADQATEIDPGDVTGASAADAADAADTADAADAADGGIPAHRYTAELANEIEARWQERWDADRTFWSPNPVGPLAEPNAELVTRPKLYVLDMFPYPSGVGLHVGHPLGYIATDIWSRFQRMRGRNVLHAMGYDAFGLPAEQYAVQTGTHPRVTTERNIDAMKRQLRRLGLAHDPRRGISTTDVGYYRWTQWIFLQIFNSWFDPDQGKARPIAELEAELDAGTRPTRTGAPWGELDEHGRRRELAQWRLAYRAELPVNWCPGLGTVLANEEVTPDGRSERGNFPVYQRPLAQWVMRITAYADRLIDDLDDLDWPEAIRTMQRNWIGRSHGAQVRFPVADDPAADPAGRAIEVFTTRPDTLFGATYMVLAPEHPLVDELTGPTWPEGTPSEWTGGAATPREAVAGYRAATARTSELARAVADREKTGVFVGAHAINPTNGERIPIFVADYVLMGYGTGAIMAVPGQDERDWEFAERFGLPIIRTVQPPDGFDGAYTGEGPAINSGFLDGLGVADAKRRIIDWLEAEGKGEGTVTYKLRDWLFSRQRYWGEPFPIVYDEGDEPIALPESMLPVELPEIDDFMPKTSDDPDAMPEPPLARATDWAAATLDLGDGRGPRPYRRELNTMPQWAGSCWYFLRYLDPEDDRHLADPANERYWMVGTRADGRPAIGGVDLYVGGVEHGVLHLLYARFWQKVLYDLGHVSTPEPFQRLFNQGYIQAAAYQDERGFYVEAEEVEARDGGFRWHDQPVTRVFGKMGKSLKNAVAPDDICRDYGADTLRLYEMYMGRLEQSKPWNTRDIVGVFRFLQRVWRLFVDEETGRSRVVDAPADDETRRRLHQTIAAVGDDLEDMRFNTAIAKLIELTNHLTPVVAGAGHLAREVADPLVLMLSPMAPHVGEELWARTGHHRTLAYEPWPRPDPALLVEDEVEIVVQVNGKPRGSVVVPASAGGDEDALVPAARAHPNVAAHLDGRTIRKVIVVPGRLVNLVVG